MRQDLQIDAGLVHLADAQRAEIVEPFDDITTSAGAAAELLDLGVLVMPFERDDVGLLCYFCPPSLCLARAGPVRQGRAKIKPSRRTKHSISAAPPAGSDGAAAVNRAVKCAVLAIEVHRPPAVTAILDFRGIDSGLDLVAR
jgi:hypothetical protein